MYRALIVGLTMAALPLSGIAQASREPGGMTGLQSSLPPHAAEADIAEVSKSHNGTYVAGGALLIDVSRSVARTLEARLASDLAARDSLERDTAGLTLVSIN